MLKIRWCAMGVIFSFFSWIVFHISFPSLLSFQLRQFPFSACSFLGSWTVKSKTKSELLRFFTRVEVPCKIDVTVNNSK